MPHKDPEMRRLQSAKWRRENPERAKILRRRGTDRQRERYQTDPQYREAFLAVTRKWKREHQKTYAERLNQNPLQLKANKAIHRKITSKEWPSASELLCSICGAQADHYHHHFGYEQEHWYDVIPVCVQCHTDIHNNLKEQYYG